MALVLALALVGGWALHLKAPVDDRPTAGLLPQTQAGSDHWGTAGETLIGSAGPAAAPRDRLMLSGVEPGTSRDVAPSAEGLGSGIGGGVALVTTGVLDPGDDDTPKPPRVRAPLGPLAQRHDQGC